MRQTSPHSDLLDDIRRSGYYPELVADVIDLALAGEEVVAHLLQPETTFDDAEVRRHLTALVLTPRRLLVAHVDDQVVDGALTALASTEAVPLRELRSVVLTQGFTDPAAHGGSRRRDLTMSLGWGAVQRLDLEPAGCADPSCEADHGLTGAATPDDLVVRVSAEAEGEAALAVAVTFARSLSAATSRA
ncbi:DUF5998 family protein [Litorihabitans aurantiacus]|uniref:Phosphodiesterase n=1 Tax=Litorihabitans aurantiacus TaxID=1930061 RepID=A0AA37XE28_9MICO|nr:DUF5998 family protein [Litorihabitans aurantiacus]GMA31456.1 hypothetical protein GCM10025875_14480 [Litorihabitans aurantiacus]